MADRTIVVKEDGKVIYEGPDNRDAQKIAYLEPRKSFGLSADTWVKIAGFLLAVVLFYYRTDDFMKAQTKINDYLVTFTKNSDGYHSAKTGMQFEQGKPVGQNDYRKLFRTTSALAAEKESHD